MLDEWALPRWVKKMCPVGQKILVESTKASTTEPSSICFRAQLVTSLGLCCNLASLSQLDVQIMSEPDHKQLRVSPETVREQAVA